MKETGERGSWPGVRSTLSGKGRWRMGCFVVLLALAHVEGAGGVTARAELERTSLILGDSVDLYVSVSGARGGTISAGIPPIEGLAIRRTGSRWSFGNLGRTDTLTYVVTPSREGKFVIPPIVVQADGQTLRTNELVLVVGRAPETGSEMRLRASVSKRECYVLEPVEATFRWYTATNIGLYELNIPLLADKDELSLELLPAASPADEIEANRYRLRASVSRERLDGTEYVVRTVTFRLFPPQPGTYTIRRATVTATGYRVETDWLGFTQRVPTGKRLFSASEPIELVVKDLPAEGKPAGFTGAVGKYTISVETEDTQVKLGDPILLKIGISGSALLERAKKPLLSKDAAFAKDFLINESLAPGDVSGNRVTFEQTIRPNSVKVKEIPSVSFAYFDPERGAYEVARSKPIPIMVLPTTEVTAEDVVKFGQPTVAEATRLEERPGGILANYNHLDALRDQAVRWPLLSLLGLPPAAYVVVLVVVSRRRRLAGNVALARSKSARRVLRRHLAEAKSHLRGDDRTFYDSLARGISRFTSDKLNLGTGELTAYDVEALANESRIDSGIARRIREMLVECDAGRFAPSAQSAEDRRDLLHRAEELARTLERRL